MPEHLRALFYILLLVAPVFILIHRQALSVTDDSDFRRRRNLWFVLTLLAFLSGNFWIYVVAGALLLVISARKEQNIVALFFILLFVAPDAQMEIPLFGLINYLFLMSPQRLLVLVLLLPVFLRMLLRPGGLRFGCVSTDFFVLGYVLLVVALNFRETTFTDSMRYSFYQFTDVLLPYVVISRSLADSESWKDSLFAYVLATLVMAPIAVFEAVRFWLLYEALLGAWDVPRGLGSYLARSNLLRAGASPVSSIALGYLMAIAIGLSLYLQRYTQSGFFRNAGFLVLIAGLLAALSRGPWIGATVMVVVWIATGRNAVSRLFKMGVGAVVSLLLVSLLPGGQVVVNLIPFLGETDKGTIDYRELLLEKSIQVIARNPLFGSSDYLATPELESMRQGQGIIDLVNTYLQVALETGLVGLGLFVGVFLSICLKLYGFIRSSADKSAKEVELCRAMLATIAGILVIILTVSSVSFIPLVYWSIAGVGAACVMCIPRWQQNTVHVAIEEPGFKIGYYLDIARRRWRLLVLSCMVILSASIAVSFWLPPVYSSTGIVLVESQEIPDDMIRSAITAYPDERVQVIQQLVMTRSNLLQVIDKYDLFAEDRDKLRVSEQVALMRQKIAVTRIFGDSFSSRSGAIAAFTVTFEDRSPELAYAVADELVTLFLEENVRTRTTLALETTAFFQEEAAKLKLRLEEIEEQIANYKQENSQALPEHLDLHMDMLERTESSLEDVARDIRSAEDENRFLEVELSAIQAGVANSNSQINVSTPEQELLAAEAELAELEASYSQLHPDVKRQKNRIARLQKQVDMRKFGGQGSGTLSNATQGIDVARVRAGIVSMQERIRSLKSQYARLAEERSRLEAAIARTPLVERTLIVLNRDYDNMLERYNEMQSKEMQAQLTESLEQENKAERFLLIEPPSLPERPIRPSRKKFVALGFILALLGSVGLLFLVERSDKRLFEVESFARLLDEIPLAVIPYIITTEETERYKRYRRWAVSGGLAAGIVLLVGVHVFLMPLDALAVKIMARLG